MCTNTFIISSSKIEKHLLALKIFYCSNAYNYLYNIHASDPTKILQQIQIAGSALEWLKDQQEVNQQYKSMKCFSGLH